MTGRVEPVHALTAAGLDAFLDELRRAEWKIGVGEQLAARRVLAALAARGEVPRDAEELARWIGPVIATSRAQQGELARRLADWLRRRAATPAVAPQGSEAEDELEDLGRRWRIWASAGLIGLVLGLAGLLVDWTPSEDRASGGGPIGFPEVVEDVSSGADAEAWPGWLVPAGLLAVVALALASRRAWWRQTAGEFLERRQAHGTPTVHRLRVARLAAELFEPLQLARTARTLRIHERVASDRLDVDSTVRATAEQPGGFRPVYGTRPCLPEYLALIDRASIGDQRARLVDALLDRLEAEGVFVTRYSFDGDPRVCFPAGPGARSVRLDALAARHGEHRLWLFSDGEGLVSPRSGKPVPWLGQLSAWGDRSVLTFEPPVDWGAREEALRAAGFSVLPAGEHELLGEGDPERVVELVQRLASELPAPELPPRFEHRRQVWLAPDPPGADEVEQGLAELRVYLGRPGMLWLAACAVYPDLHWELTLFLGHRLRAGATGAPLALETLAALTRLPWFRAGHLPEWLRVRLLDELPPGREDDVRRGLRGLLISALDGPVDGFELEIAEDDARESVAASLWRGVANQLRERPEAAPLHDRVFLGFMNHRHAFALPRRVGRLLRATGRQLRRERTEPLPLRRTLPALVAAAAWGCGATLLAGSFPAVATALALLYCLIAPFANLDLVRARAGLGRRMVRFIAEVVLLYAPSAVRHLEAWAFMLVPLVGLLGWAVFVELVVSLAGKGGRGERRWVRSVRTLADLVLPDRWVERLALARGERASAELGPPKQLYVWLTSAAMGGLVASLFSAPDFTELTSSWDFVSFDALLAPAPLTLLLLGSAVATRAAYRAGRLAYLTSLGQFALSFFGVAPVFAGYWIVSAAEDSDIALFGPESAWLLADVLVAWTVGGTVFLEVSLRESLDRRAGKPPDAVRGWLRAVGAWLDRWMPDRLLAWLAADHSAPSERVRSVERFEELVSKHYWKPPLATALVAIAVGSFAYLYLDLLLNGLFHDEPRGIGEQMGLILTTSVAYGFAFGVRFGPFSSSATWRVVAAHGGALFLGGWVGIGAARSWDFGFAGWAIEAGYLTRLLGAATLFFAVAWVTSAALRSFGPSRLTLRLADALDRRMPDRVFFAALPTSSTGRARRRWLPCLLFAVLVGGALAPALGVDYDAAAVSPPLAVFLYGCVVTLAEARRPARDSRLRITAEVVTAQVAHALCGLLLALQPSFADNPFQYVTVPLIGLYVAVPLLLAFGQIESFRRRSHPLYRAVFEPITAWGDLLAPDQLARRLWALARRRRAEGAAATAD
ncbi:MAG: hypothetical protein AAF682_03605 [Planctomycetota bacterium]